MSSEIIVSIVILLVALFVFGIICLWVGRMIISRFRIIFNGLRRLDKSLAIFMLVLFFPLAAFIGYLTMMFSAGGVCSIGEYLNEILLEAGNRTGRMIINNIFCVAGVVFALPLGFIIGFGSVDLLAVTMGLLIGKLFHSRDVGKIDMDQHPDGPGSKP